MTETTGNPRVRVAIELTEPEGDLPRWLGEAAAFDAAGADRLCWNATAPGVDPIAVTAALAAVTSRATLVVAFPAEVGDAAWATIQGIARERVRPAASDGDPWPSTPVPEGRAAWRAAHQAAVDAGHEGLSVPADPRLLDLLRNPNDPGEREDLHLTVG